MNKTFEERRAELTKAFMDGRLAGYEISEPESCRRGIKALSGRKVIHVTDSREIVINVSIGMGYDDAFSAYVRYDWIFKRNKFHRVNDYTDLDMLIKRVKEMEKKAIHKHIIKIKERNASEEILVADPVQKDGWPYSIKTSEAQAILGKLKDPMTKVVWMGTYLHMISEKKKDSVEYTLRAHNRILDIGYSDKVYDTSDGRLNKEKFEKLTHDAAVIDADYLEYAKTEHARYKTTKEAIYEKIAKNEGLVREAVGDALPVKVKDEFKTSMVTIGENHNVNVTVYDDETTCRLDINNLEIPMTMIADLMPFLMKAAVYQAMRKVE